MKNLDAQNLASEIFSVETEAGAQIKGGWPPQRFDKKAEVKVLEFSSKAEAKTESKSKPAPKPAPAKEEEDPILKKLGLPPLPEPQDVLKPDLKIKSMAPEKPRPPIGRSKGSNYTLGPGDTVIFSLFERGDLKRKVKIAPDGTVSYLQAVAVNANGLTVDELRYRMEKELRQYKRDAKVIVTPVELESKQFPVIGRVKKPGSFVLDRPTTVLEGIAKAEGVEVGTIRGSAFGLADFQRSFVSRKGKKLNIDLAKLYHEGDLSQNQYLQPGDYLYVASALENECYVLGAVRRGGRIKMPTKLTITSAIATAGGI